MIDEQFLGRVYRSSFYWSLLILSFLMMSRLDSASTGFAIGVTLGLGVLRCIEAIVRVVIVPRAKYTAKVKMLTLGILKYLLLAVILALVVRNEWISLPAFVFGVAVPTAVIFLKTLAHYFHSLEFHPFPGGHYDPRLQETD